MFCEECWFVHAIFFLSLFLSFSNFFTNNNQFSGKPVPYEEEDEDDDDEDEEEAEEEKEEKRVEETATPPVASSPPPSPSLPLSSSQTLRRDSTQLDQVLSPSSPSPSPSPIPSLIFTHTHTCNNHAL